MVQLQKLTEFSLHTPYWQIGGKIFELPQFGDRSRPFLRWICPHQAHGGQRFVKSTREPHI